MFWVHRLNFLAILLLPISIFWMFFIKIKGIASRLFCKKTVKTPVISFSQITSFKIGKTPLISKVAKYLGAPVIVVDKDYRNTKMLAEEGVFSGGGMSDLATAEFLGKKYPAVIIDGDICNADIKVLVFDDFFGIGNGLPLPAGPMTDSVRHGIKKTDAVVIIQGDDKSVPAGILKLARRYNKPLFLARREMDVTGLFGKFVAFTSIPYPARFFESLRGAPAIRLVDRIKLRPGRLLDKETTINLFYRARRFDARLITTEKDWHGLPGNIRAKVRKASIQITPPPNFYIWLEKKLGERNV